MPAKITSVIPSQPFELVRDRIGAILTLEFAAQHEINAAQPEITGIWIERVDPFGPEELPAINVQFGEGRTPENGRASGFSDSTLSYWVDVFTDASTTTTGNGDNKARVLCQKICGMIRAIIEDNEYKTLDFPAPPASINRPVVTSIQLAEGGTMTANNSAMGRVTVQVEAHPDLSKQVAVPIGGSDTSVTIDETDKGLKYIFNA